ncbi:MAG TPA: ABC transporter ATP-binding protein [Vicinamibacterales bacterium]|jgi:ABC-type multidrug transport system fused ATPase/permease subunit|nr:ABC transporter ATP-binding protein [Vicinamibacterales bacterium]
MNAPADRRVRMALVRTFGPELWIYRRTMMRSYAYRILAIGATLVAPWPLKIIIDHVLSSRPLPSPLHQFLSHTSPQRIVVAMALAIVTVTAVRALAEFLQTTTSARLREQLNVRIRDRMLAHVETLPPTIHTAHRSGELVMRLVDDVDLFVRLLTRTLPTLFEYLVTTAATLALMFWLQPWLALISVALVPGLVALMRYFGVRLGAASREKRRHEGEVAGLTQEIVRGLPVIQALGGERQARERFRQLNTRSQHAGQQATRVAASMERTLRIVHGAATAVVVGIGALLVLRGSLTLGALIVLSTYLTQLLRPVERLNDLAETASKALAGGERLLGLLDQQPAVRDAPGAVTLGRARGVIELRDVWFSYSGPGRQRGTVLRGVNLRLQPGELAVLVGASGAGKSTLLSLLVRLFDPTEGTILLDGIPLTMISIDSLRRQIATMAQDTRLFAGSIRQAVAPVEGTIADERIWDALALVAMDGFVRGLPERLDTALGEDGVNLSGGQRQRLSLARAFLLDRPVLLLDEPLSNVDAESEAVIVAALARWRSGRACLAITHRLTLFQHADVVYRLQEGRLVEHPHARRLVGRGREQRI